MCTADRIGRASRNIQSFSVIIPFITILLLAVLAGCDSPEKEQVAQPVVHNATQTVEKAAQPEYGGRLILGMIAEPSNLIPMLSSDSASSEIQSYLYTQLLKYNKNLEIVTDCAESYEVLEDGKVIRITMKKGVLWDDGVELTTDDVKFTFDAMRDPNTPTAYAEDYLAVKSFTVVDKYTFEVRYEKPFARSLITWMHGIWPKHKLEGQDLTSTPLSRNPLSAGPFRLKSWEQGRIVLEARDTYFEGRPYLDQIVYKVIPDQGTMFLELKAGNVDMMSLTPQQYKFQTTGPDWDKNFRKYEYLSFGYSYMGYNLKSPLFTDVKVRQALAHAVNQQEIIQGALLGLGKPAMGPYKPGTWVYNDAIQAYAYDPDLARTMLAEAGWTDSDEDGILDKDGKPFAFTLLTNQGNDLRIKTATIIQSRLKEVGIQVEIRTVEWASFIKEFVDKGRFDALVLGWNITQDPDIYDVWHSSKAVPGGLNFAQYISEEADELLEKGRSTLVQEERKRYYDMFQEVLYRDQPYLFLYVPYSLPIIQERFEGIEPAPAGVTHNIIKWWVPKDKQRFNAKDQKEQ